MQYLNLGRLQDNLAVDVRLNNCGFYKCVDKPLHTRRIDKLREDHHIILTCSGVLRVLVNNEIVSASDGSLIYIPPYTPHDYIYTPGHGTTYYWLHFEGQKVNEIMTLTDLNWGIYHIENMLELVHILDNILSVPSYHKDSYYMALNGYLQIFLSTLCRALTMPYPFSSTSGKLLQIVNSIRNTPEDALTNPEYADLCGISEYHFIRLFRQHTGMTPHQFRNQSLMVKAQHLLLDTDMNISEIAQAIKIDDALYFSRLFKKHFGTSPSIYRTAHR